MLPQGVFKRLLTALAVPQNISPGTLRTLACGVTGHTVGRGTHWKTKKARVAVTHYSDVIMSAMASQITSVSIFYSTVCSDADQRKHKAPRHWPLWGEFIGDDRWFLSQRVSNAENVSIWWRHHGLAVTKKSPHYVISHFSSIIVVSREKLYNKLNITHFL